MKITLIVAYVLIITSAFAADLLKFVSPDRSSTLLVDQSGKRDLITLKSGNVVHRLFYEDLESLFNPVLAKVFNVSLERVGKIVLPEFISARWLSAEEVEIKGESGMTVNPSESTDSEDHGFTFTAVVSKSGNVKNLTVVPSD
jgi:hypothetical protein